MVSFSILFIGTVIMPLMKFLFSLIVHQISAHRINKRAFIFFHEMVNARLIIDCLGGHYIQVFLFY